MPALSSKPCAVFVNPQPRAARGMVLLVITLSLVVLLTFVIVAFFAATTVNRTVENASSSAVSARLLADGAIGAIEGELLQEIIAKSDVSGSGNQTIYLPKTPADMVPQRSIPGALAGSPAFENLVKQSGMDFFTGGTPFIFKAGGNSTESVSANGRLVRASRWSAPLLTSGNFTAATAPKWIHVNASGYSANPNATTIGRIAFNIYDTGGLLDINAAGHAASAPSAVIASKGSAVWADLTAIPGIAAATEDAWPPSWRNRHDDWNAFATASSTAHSTLRYYQQTGWLTPFSQSGGGNSDKLFTSRQDLIRYARAHPGTFGNDPAAALANLSTFSRTPAAPALPYIDATQLGFPSAGFFSDAYRSNQTFTGYRDDGTSYVYQVKAGTPVLHKRFSLGKISRETSGGTVSWLTPTGPGPGISPAAIRAVFGLEWNGALERWDYRSPTGGGLAQFIKTPDEIAAGNRPPDFFEILKAVIRPDSLGGCQPQSGGNLLDLTAQTLQESEDYHIFRIGASILDNADPDNFPTRIAFDLSGAVEAVGVEDLPYLSGAIVRFAFQRREITAAGTPANTNTNIWRFSNLRHVLVPIIHNPHRADSTSSQTPALSVKLLHGEVTGLDTVLGEAALATQPFPFLQAGYYGDFPRVIAPDSISIPANLLDAYRNGYCVIDLQRRLSTREFPNSQLNAFTLLTLPDQPRVPASGTLTKPELNQRTVIDLDKLLVALTYRSPGGNERVYDTLGGAYDGSDPSAWAADFANFTCGTELTVGTDRNYNNAINNQLIDASTHVYLGKFDPRTPRYGMTYTFSWTGSTNSAVLLQPAPKPSQVLLREDTGDARGADIYQIELTEALGSTFFPASPYPGARQFYPAAMARGGIQPLEGSLLVNLPDRPQDGSQTRPNFAFAFDGSEINNPLWNPGDERLTVAPNSHLRPAILQRPYRNVAELGHVFRDQPWKQLDFAHGTSPDAALLEMFDLTEVESELVAGKVNPNSAPAAVFQALLQQAGRQLQADARDYQTTLSSPQDAAAVATPLRAAIQNARLVTDSAWPRQALSRTATAGTLDGALVANLGSTKPEREALARALSGSTQTRTWNLLVDVISQSGKQTGGGFVVDGESRSWTHLAIDRFTGQILDRQTEMVNE